MISQTRNKFCFAAVLTIFTHGIHYFVLDNKPLGISLGIALARHVHCSRGLYSESITGALAEPPDRGEEEEALV